jgi:hypothetical protein
MPNAVTIVIVWLGLEYLKHAETTQELSFSLCRVQIMANNMSARDQCNDYTLGCNAASQNWGTSNPKVQHRAPINTRRRLRKLDNNLSRQISARRKYVRKSGASVERC